MTATHTLSTRLSFLVDQVQKSVDNAGDDLSTNNDTGGDFPSGDVEMASLDHDTVEAEHGLADGVPGVRRNSVDDNSADDVRKDSSEVEGEVRQVAAENEDTSKQVVGEGEAIMDGV